MVGGKQIFKNLVNVSEFQGHKIPCTTSLKVAEVFRKEHKDILRKIEKLTRTGDFDQRNFAPINYTDEGGRNYPMYLLDERFTTFLIMGFTGKEARKWKLAYIDEFQRMRKQQYRDSRIVRTRFDDPAELNKAVNDVLVHVRAAMGKETKTHHFIAMAENINEFTFGDRGKGKQLRQNMDISQYQCLNRNLSGSIKGLLNGALHKKELKEHLMSLGLVSDFSINPSI